MIPWSAGVALFIGGVWIGALLTRYCVIVSAKAYGKGERFPSDGGITRLARLFSGGQD